MQYALLATVKHRVVVGAPTPFNIRNTDHALLLARGQIIGTDEQLEALFERGALVDMEELKGPRAEILQAHPEHLPGLWLKSIDQVGRTLRQIEQDPTHFIDLLNTAAQPVLALIERDPDLAVFQIVRQDEPAKMAYGVSHAVHAAIAAHLVAQRMGWSTEQINLVFKAALTMNISMVDLQGKLALQVTPVTAVQRQTIHTHPERSVAMLEAAGITDRDWLHAILEHHETPDGKGYPHHASDVSEMAALLRRADVYTAKLSGRNSRRPMAANQAGREMFTQDRGHPMTAAIIKEFGIYPPGCFVTLACGESGVVIKRGDSANTPVVAALTNRRGEPLIEPVRRNTAQKDFAIVGVITESALRVRVSPEKLVVLGS